MEKVEKKYAEKVFVMRGVEEVEALNKLLDDGWHTDRNLTLVGKDMITQLVFVLIKEVST